MFKVGDKVKIIGKKCTITGGCPDGCAFYNKIGTITEFGKPCIGIKNFAKMGDQWCSGFTEDMLELVDKTQLDLSHIKKYKVAIFLEGLK
jgi:hypothetical protein